MLKIVRPILVTFSIILYLGWIYFPALTTHYLHHDDVNYFLRTTTQTEPKGYQFSLAIGRFVGARIYAAYGALVNSVADLNLLRISSFIQIIICILILYHLLTRYLKNRFHALSISLLIGTLPGFQVLVTFAAYAFQTTGALLGLTAAYILSRIPADENNPKYFIHPLNLLSIPCLIAAIATHPSTSLLYWAGITILFLSYAKDYSLKTTALKMINPFFTAFVSMGLYAVIIGVTKKYFNTTHLGFYDPYGITVDYIEKLKWFFREPFFNSLNLWNIFPNHLIANGVLIFILITAFAYGACSIIKSPISIRKNLILRFIFIGILLSALLFLSFITNLLAVSNAPYYRCCIALGTIILILLFLSIRQWFELFPTMYRQHMFSLFLLLCLIFVGYYARLTLVNNRVKPSQIEFAHLMSSLKKVNLFQYQRIYVIQLDRFLIKTRYDEFGTPTTHYDEDIIGFISAGIREYVKNEYTAYYIGFDFKTKIATYIFMDKNGEKHAFYVMISAGAQDKAINGMDATLVIDMTPLYYKSGELAYLRLE
ncbi:MAG: hypothetical protein KBD53_01100 [Candidatus Omnitrophica bacterium]|nr:hypothetical protein [Candidatus Omnitrophota bacterium]